MKTYYKIHEISKLYNIGPDSLRYYEKLGLLHPKRDKNGYRMYNLKDLYKLTVIRDLRELNFSMKQIGEYLNGQSLDNTISLLEQEQKALRRQRKLLQLQEKLPLKLHLQAVYLCPFAMLLEMFFRLSFLTILKIL